MNYTINTFELNNQACLSWDGCTIAEEVYKRACCDATTLEEAYNSIYEALCDELIYTADQWTVMKDYQSPDTANYDKAFNLFYDDLCKYFYDCVEVEEAE